VRADEETIASLLRRVGYATGGFGKWGCGGRGSTGVAEKHGFDIFVAYYDQVHAHSYHPPYIIRNSEELVLPGNRGGRSGRACPHYVIIEEPKKQVGWVKRTMKGDDQRAGGCCYGPQSLTGRSGSADPPCGGSFVVGRRSLFRRAQCVSLARCQSRFRLFPAPAA